jgi:apoptosis-inducing factor 2
LPGAVGIEFAGEIKNYYPGISVTLIHSRSQVLSSEPLPSEVKDQVKTILEEEGVDVILNNRASTESLPSGKFEVTLANDTKLSADLVLDTTKKGSPTTDFLPAESLDEEKEIKVNPELTFKSDIPNAEAHFGVGDVVAWGGIKRAGGAMGMGHLAAFNVFASILNKEQEDTAPIYELGKLPEYNNVIGIAIGRQCLTYAKSEGMKHGVEVMKNYFGDDLGWAANLKYLGLTDVVEMEKAPEQVEMGEVGVQPIAAAA